jgi:hypothetical protein
MLDSGVADENESNYNNGNNDADNICDNNNKMKEG